MTGMGLTLRACGDIHRRTGHPSGLFFSVARLLDSVLASTVIMDELLNLSLSVLQTVQNEDTMTVLCRAWHIAWHQSMRKKALLVQMGLPPVPSLLPL